MSPTTLPTARRSPGLQGRHVLIAISGFFAIVFAVNGVLLYEALSTHSGLVANEPYRKGRDYNRRIDADERQRTLGWREAITLERSGRLLLAIEDAQGRPVTRLEVSAVVGRPSTMRHDTSVGFVEEAPGRYRASAGALDGGAWLVSVEARLAEDTRVAERPEPVYRSRRRLWLAP